MPSKSLTPLAIKKLMRYPFPGNVRELKSVVELAVTLSDDGEIDAEHLILNEMQTADHIVNEEMTLREYNLHIVQRLMEKYNNKPKVVADKLGVGVATIYRMLKETD